MNARRTVWCVSLVLLLCVPRAWAQDKAAATAAPTKAADLLGRDNPRGTVIGFITAARQDNYELAAQYINPPSKRDRGDDLARQLYIVLNGRLNARIYAVSDRPEGSLANPLAPDHEVIGTVSTPQGPQDVVLERVSAANGTKVWLFARQTLQWVPDVYQDVKVISIEQYLPRWLTVHVLGIRVADWIGLILLIPLLYKALAVIDWLIAFVILHSRLRRWAPFNFRASSIPSSVRLLVLALLIELSVGSVDLPLAERRLWALVATILTVLGVIGVLLRAVELAERIVFARLSGAARVESQGLLRLVRRVIQGLIIAVGIVIALRYFGFDPTTALAGLGIGGIAIALGAQKTLENVIGGFSIVFDKAIRVGDFLRVDQTIGTVEFVGLRSTRIRTLDRTVVAVPNGQMATVNIETFSRRDRFWFHHTVGLTYATTVRQLRELRNAFERLLLEHPSVDAPSVRVRFIRLGAYSLDVELFAYFRAADYESFLSLQGDLLLKVMELVEAAGAEIAFPSQTLHVANTRVPS